MNKKLNIVLVGQGPDTSSRLKTISYAPFALGAYLDLHLPPSLKSKVKIEVFDFNWNTKSQHMASKIIAKQPDLVGFSVYLWNYNQVLECAFHLKTFKQDILIVLGGPQVSPLAKEVLLDNPYLDIISCASLSGEVTLLDIVKAIFDHKDFSRVNGICYRDSEGNIVETSPEIRPIDYAFTPSPYIREENLSNPLEINSLAGDAGDGEFMAVIESSRGCPYDCGYCFWGQGKRKIDYFPLNRVLQEIEIIYNNPKVKEVYFADSNLLANIERAETIIGHIIKQKSQAKTDLEINFIYLKEKTAKLLNNLPNFEFLIAIQSVNPQALKYIGGMRPSPEIFLEKLQKLKIWIPQAKYRVDIMLGLPGDDLDGFLKTLDFALSLEPFYIVLSYPVYLLPGSSFFENKEAWRLRYNPRPPFSIIETPTFPQKDIEEALRISIWTQILTFYYPTIAKFFYDLSKLDGIRIQRLLNWIVVIEKKVNLFGSYQNLTDLASRSASEWNILKKHLLEKASRTENSHNIYSSIYELETSFKDGRLAENIRLGCELFEYMIEHRMEAVGFNSYHLLPSNIIKNNDFSGIKNLFSSYKE